MARSKYEVAESLALATTSLALDKNASFPQVTVPNFEVRASNARELSDTDILIWCPFVSRSQQAVWGNHVTANQGWLRESYEYLGLPTDDLGQIPPEIQATRDFSSPDYNEGMHPALENMMAPIWYVQTSR